MRVPLFRSLACSLLVSLSAFALTPAEQVTAIRNQVAADDRITYFDVKASAGPAPKSVVLVGRVLTASQKQSLMAAFASDAASVVDKVEVFPFADAGDKPYAIAKMPLLNIRKDPRHSGELITQCLMGQPLKLIKREANWWLVQLEDDNYVGWAEEKAISRTTEAGYRQWRSAKKVMVTQPSTDLLASPRGDAAFVAKVYLTTSLPVIGQKGSFTQVRLPGGELAYALDGATKPAPTKGDPRAVPQIIAAAKRLMGAPYLWGGTSPVMVDCSGLNQQVYKLYGYLLPRDADQQQDALKVVLTRNDLKPGDLVFFPGHTGMYIGSGDFIHSSTSRGGVAINSFDPKRSNYDAWFITNYKGAGRVIN